MLAAHRHPHRRRVAPRHFAWLLWLAMLLPLAQTLAACHVYSHTGEAVGGEVSGAVELGKVKHAGGAALCDLCLAGNAVHGGALPSAALLPALPALHHAAPAAAFVSPWTPPLALAYQGRAPPFALS